MFKRLMVHDGVDDWYVTHDGEHSVVSVDPDSPIPGTIEEFQEVHMDDCKHCGQPITMHTCAFDPPTEPKPEPQPEPDDGEPAE